MKGEGVKGHLDLILLGALADGPRHGYAVISALRDGSDGVIDLQEGSVYPALHRMEALGLLHSEWQPVGGRRRRVYRLTARGTEALAAEERDWRRLSAAVEAVLAPAAPIEPRGGNSRTERASTPGRQSNVRSPL